MECFVNPGVSSHGDLDPVDLSRAHAEMTLFNENGFPWEKYRSVITIIP